MNNFPLVIGGAGLDMDWRSTFYNAGNHRSTGMDENTPPEGAPPQDERVALTARATAMAGSFAQPGLKGVEATTMPHSNMGVPPGETPLVLKVFGAGGDEPPPDKDKAEPDAPQPPSPSTSVPNTGWMGSFDDGMAAVRKTQRRAASIAAESGFGSQPLPPPDTPPTTPPSETNVVLLPQSISVGTSVGRGDMPEIDSIPLQEVAASQFALDAEGRIDLVPDPPIVDDTQSEIYQEVRHKADALSTLGHNQLGDLAKPVDRFRAALPEDIQRASITRLWSRGNSLRRRGGRRHHDGVTSVGR